MKSQLYVPEITRRYLKSVILDYVKIYLQKLLPVFKDIERDADKYTNDFFDNFMSQPAYDDFNDPSSIAEEAEDIRVDHYLHLKLGKYNLTATWHATLYQVWEQQLRWFLFQEISHVYNIQFGTFCTKLSEIKEKFKCHNVEIGRASCRERV